MPCKTPLAHEWLSARDPRLDRPSRALLISIDGRRSQVELESFARALRLGPAAVDLLQRQGLIEVAAGGSDALRPLPDALREPGRGRPAVDPLAEVKRYVVELAFLMLAGHGDETLELGGAIPGRAALLAWCERCAEDIERYHGAQRCEQFRSMVRAALGAAGR